MFSIGPIGGALLSFISLPIVTWFFSAEDIGRITMLQITSSLCIIVFGFGLDQAYVREYHEVPESRASLLKNAVMPGLLVISVLAPILMMSPGFLSYMLFDVRSFEWSFLIFISFVCVFISRFLSLILRMQERGLAFSISQLLPKVIFLGVVSSYAIFPLGLSFGYLLAAHCISVVSVTAVYLWSTRVEWFSAIMAPIEGPLSARMLRFGAPLILGGLAFWALNAMDKLFLRYFSDFQQLGIYSVASSFASVAIVFQTIFSTIWTPLIYKWSIDNVHIDNFGRLINYVLAVVVFVLIFMGLFSWVISYILPEKYKSIHFIVVACVVAPLFYTLSEATAVGIGIERKTSYSMLCSILALFISFFLNWFLVPHFGAAGAAMSSAVSFWFFLVIRTELSCLVWQPIDRRKVYLSTASCLVIALCFVMYGEENQKVFIFIWCFLGLINFFVFKRQVLEAYYLVVSCFRRQI